MAGLAPPSLTTDRASPGVDAAREAFTARLFLPLLYAGLARRTYSWRSARMGSMRMALRAGA